MLRRLDYLEKIEDEVLYDIMFNLESVAVEKENTILNDKEEMLNLTFVEQGQIDVYTKFEGSDFVIDKLYKGSAINQRVCFTQDPVMLFFKCATDVKLLVLPHQKMTQLIEKYEDKPFGKNLLILQNKLFKLQRKYPCDYVVRIPRYIMLGMKTSQDAIYRNNCLKNVVMRIVLENREKKKLPKLADFIAIYREKKNEKGSDQQQVKGEFMKKFRMLYADEHEKKSTDKKYNDMIKGFRRLENDLSG